MREIDRTDEAPGAVGDRLRVVIADDAPAMRLLLRRMLEDSGAFDVVGEAGDGEEAVRMADALRPDVVLLDLAMPVMDGLAAIPRIRRTSAASRIVVVSAVEAGRVRDQALASGADTFIEKRLLSDALAQRLVEACRTPARRSNPEVGHQSGPDSIGPGTGPAEAGGGARPLAPEQEAPGARPPDEDWLRLAFLHSPIGVALLDREGRVREVNDAFCQIVRRPLPEVVGGGLHEIVHPGDVERHAALRSRLLRTGRHAAQPGFPGRPGDGADPDPAYQADLRFLRPDGHVAWTLVTCSLWRAGDGDSSRFVLQVVDVTERKVAEAANVRAEELRERYEKELARSNADLAQFATVAAHDLKSPLQVISGFAGLLEQTHGEVLDERGQEFLAFIVKSAVRMNVLIDDLLTYAKVGADRRPPVAVPLDRILEEVRTSLASEIEASGASVEADPLPVVTGDPGLFSHLLRELVANGLKFVAEGSSPEVRISASRMINAWCVDVVDNGIGIEAQHRSYVFGMFQRLHRNEYEGTGIGLAICKRLVEQRGGSIWVEENPQAGSRFRFTVPDEVGPLRVERGGEVDDLSFGHDRSEVDLSIGSLATTVLPAAADPGPNPAASDDPLSDDPGPGHPGLRSPAPGGLDILLVEDDDVHARLVAETLAGDSDGVYRLRRARDLAEARAELHRDGADCVLLDLFLPDSQGLDSLSQLTTLDPLVPIVILTSVADEQLGLRAVHEGAQDYLVKGTVDGPRLSRSLRHAIERKALEARFAEQALHDPLTGLANRTLLVDRLRLELARSGRTGAGVAVFYLDVDGFKAINDRWGHAAGDEVLVRLARRLARAVRPGDTVGRIGGDEFVVVCGGIDAEADLEQMQARIGEALGRPLLLGGGTELVTSSVGVALGHGSAEEPDTIIRRADEAMYQAKRSRMG